MTLKGQPVLVTGAAGLIGSNLVSRLLAEGARVSAVIHKTQPRQPALRYIHADLSTPAGCAFACCGEKYIFHCAANTTGAKDTELNPMVHVTPNIVMNALMLEAAAKAGVKKFLYFGSTTAYPAAHRIYKEEELMDGDLFHKYYFVGSMKRFTETLCRMYGEKLKTMTTIVLRPTNVYGPGDKTDLDRCHVTAALMRKVIERQNPIEVWGDGNDVRDLIYVDDMVSAAMAAMEQVEGFDCFNIGLGRGYSVKQILAFLMDIEGYSAPVKFAADKPTMIPIRLVDVSKAHRILGWSAKVDLEEGLKRTVAWYKTRTEAGVTGMYD